MSMSWCSPGQHGRCRDLVGDLPDPVLSSPREAVRRALELAALIGIPYR